MKVFTDALQAIMTINGSVVSAIVDIESGQCLARAGVETTDTLEATAIVNARMLRAKLRMAHDAYAESIEDILITLDCHYHVIRLIHSSDAAIPYLFLYLVLDRPTSNLAIARRKMSDVENAMLLSTDGDACLALARLQAMDIEPISDKVYGSNGSGVTTTSASDFEELPSFMRSDAVLKLLGIPLDESEAIHLESIYSSTT